eukprot:scaffold2385_cov178-Amphora_coffeaeformis.AAC.4
MVARVASRRGQRDSLAPCHSQLWVSESYRVMRPSTQHRRHSRFVSSHICRRPWPAVGHLPRRRARRHCRDYHEPPSIAEHTRERVVRLPAMRVPCCPNHPPKSRAQTRARRPGRPCGATRRVRPNIRVHRQ